MSTIEDIVLSYAALAGEEDHPLVVGLITSLEEREDAIRDSLIESAGEAGLDPQEVAVALEAAGFEMPQEKDNDDVAEAIGDFLTAFSESLKSAAEFVNETLARMR